MVVKSIVIDPLGDSVIVLNYPRYDFEEYRPPPYPVGLLPTPHVVETNLERHPQDSTSDADTSTYMSTPEDTDTKAPSSIPETRGDASDGDVHEEQYQYLVSSAQLCQISPYFASIAMHEFKEAIPEIDGKYYIEAEDFNPEAMEIVLYAVHDQTHKVPENVGLHTFIHIALVADYYQITESLMHCMNIWQPHLPKFSSHLYKLDDHTFRSEHIGWLFATLVFRLKDAFYWISYDVVKSCPEFSQNLNFPIGDVLDKLFVHRLKLLQKLIRHLNYLERLATEGRIICHPLRLLKRKDSISYHHVMIDISHFKLVRHPFKAYVYQDTPVAERTPCCELFDPKHDHLGMIGAVYMTYPEVNSRISCKNAGFYVTDGEESAGESGEESDDEHSDE